MAYSTMFVMESEMVFERMSAKPFEMESVRVSERVYQSQLMLS